MAPLIDWAFAAAGMKQPPLDRANGGCLVSGIYDVGAGELLLGRFLMDGGGHDCATKKVQTLKKKRAVAIIAQTTKSAPVLHPLRQYNKVLKLECSYFVSCFLILKPMRPVRGVQGRTDDETAGEPRRNRIKERRSHAKLRHAHKNRQVCVPKHAR
jgi:hypothetical protein